MERFAWVMAGGALGSGARYAIALWIGAPTARGFPWATFAVNVLGSFALAYLVSSSSRVDWLSPNLRLALGVGVLGGFTTYSSFNHEVLAALHEQRLWSAAGYVVAMLTACLVAGAAGFWLGTTLDRR